MRRADAEPRNQAVARPRFSCRDVICGARFPADRAAREQQRPCANEDFPANLASTAARLAKLRPRTTDTERSITPPAIGLPTSAPPARKPCFMEHFRYAPRAAENANNLTLAETSRR
jgi:hypothetical protein